MTHRLSRLLQSVCHSPRRWLLALAVLSGLSLGGYWGARQLWAGYHLRAAHKALDRWQFDDARTHLHFCLAVWPRDAALQLLAAQAARRAGLFDEAARHLDECRRLNGDASLRALEAALLAAQAGDVARVEEDLYLFVKEDHPQTSLILEALAHGYLHIYDLPSALGCLDLLLKREPENTHALIWRGHVWSGMANPSKALADYQRAVEIDPNNAEARLLLAETLRDKAGKPAEALSHFERLRQQQPGSLRVGRGLARCQRTLGELDKASQTLDALLAEHGEDADTLAERGEVAIQAGQLARAEVWLKRAVALNPHARQFLFSLHQLLLRRGKEDEARVYLARMQRVEADLKALEKAVQEVGKNPRDPSPRYRAGVICLRNGQEGEGLRWLLGTLQQDPNHRPTHLALADHFRQKGDKELTAYHLRKAGNQGQGSADNRPFPGP